MIKKRQVYTTGQAAKICSVSTQTIIRCCEANAIQYFKIPGSLHRRIPHNALIAFMREFNFPIPEVLLMPIELGSAVKIIQHDDPDLVGKIGIVTAITIRTASVQINAASQITRVIPLNNLKLCNN